MEEKFILNLIHRPELAPEYAEKVTGQGQYPNAYWTLTEAFGTDINSGMYTGASDDDLRKALTDLEGAIKEAK